MFSYIQSLISDPRATIMFFLLALPARLLAISAHECAHGWVAWKCGDPTAKMMGRVTLNPAKHLDLLGTVMMALLGYGWAKPVPVNPRNFRKFRRDDILVSLAGVTVNLLLFLLSYVVCALLAGIALSTLPFYESIAAAGDGMCVTNYLGQRVFLDGAGYYIPVETIIKSAPFMADYVIAPIWGRVAGYAFEMLQYFVLVNISLAVFNLIPVPPLDGSHVLGDLLPRNPFRNPRVGQAAYMVLLVLMITGHLGDLLSIVTGWAMEGVGSAVYALASLLGMG